MEKYKIGDIIRTVDALTPFGEFGCVHVVTERSVDLVNSNLVTKFMHWEPMVGELVIPIDNVDLSIDNLFYCKIWNDGDTYQCLPYYGSAFSGVSIRKGVSGPPMINGRFLSSVVTRYYATKNNIAT